MSKLHIREWRSSDYKLLSEWSDQPFSKSHVDQNMPHRGVVENGDGPVAIIGMDQYGPLGIFHVYVAPEHRNFKTVSRVYDVGMKEAKDRGVTAAMAVIPSDNEEALMMAERKGFRVLPVIMLVRSL